MSRYTHNYPENNADRAAHRSKIETLTDEYRILLWDITGQHPANDRADAVAKALRIIDAHAAERAALTEQVAQLTRERDEARALHEQALNERDEAHKALELAADLARERDDDSPPECDNCEAVMDGHMAATSDVCLDCWNRSHDAESEVSRLTEQVAQLTEVVSFLRRQNKADHDALSALRRSAEGKVLRLTAELESLRNGR